MAKKSLIFFSIATALLLGVIPVLIKRKNDMRAKVATPQKETIPVEQEKTAPTVPAKTSTVPDTVKQPEKQPQKPQKKSSTPVSQETTSTTTIKEKALQKAPQERQITIKNGITKEMLGYKYLGTHYPTKFTMAVNGKELFTTTEKELKDIKKKSELVHDATHDMSITNNTLTVRYDFDFLNGKKVGAKEIIFEVSPTENELALTFNWQKDDWRVYFEHASPIKTYDVE